MGNSTRYYSSISKGNIEEIQKAGACSPETAVTLEKLRIKQNLMIFDMLVKQKNVKSTEDGRYYIDCEKPLP